MNSSISVSLPNFNHAKYLPDSLRSLLNQSVAPKEIFVIDDCSTDDSVEIIKAFAKEHPCIRFIQNEKRMGAVYNLNLGIRQATSEFVYCGAADDKALPGFFEKAIAIMQKNPQAGLCSGFCQLMDQAGSSTGVEPIPIVAKEPRFFSKEEVRKLFLQHGSWIVGSCTVYRREALLDAGCLNAALGPFSDSFAAQLIALRRGACFLPDLLTAWRIADTNFSKSTAVNCDAWRKIIRHQAQEMRAAHGDVFPKRYTLNWEREQLYGIGLLAWENVRRMQERYFTEALKPLLPGASRLDPAISKFVLWIGKVQSLLVKTCLFARFRMYRIWARNQARKKSFSGGPHSFQTKLLSRSPF